MTYKWPQETYIDLKMNLTLEYVLSFFLGFIEMLSWSRSSNLSFEQPNYLQMTSKLKSVQLIQHAKQTYKKTFYMP